MKALYFYVGMLIGAAAMFVILSAVPEVANNAFADGFVGKIQQFVQTFRAYFSEMTRNL